MNLTTQTLEVFDPAMCCSTGACGPEVDPKLVRFAADLDWLKSQGVIVQRHNLSQNPAAFVENEAVKTALTEKGEAALPLLLVNGKVTATGRYPERGELAAWFELKPTAPNENGGQAQNMELPQSQAAACDSGCGCHAAGKPSNKRWVIGAIVLAAAGVLVARAMIKSDGASAKPTAPAFASLAALSTPKSDGGSATNAGTVPSTTDKRVELIGTLSELNALAAKLDAVFVFLPGKDGTSANAPLTPMQGAARAIESNGGQKCGLFTLKAGSPDYDEIAGKISLPGVLALVKGHGMSAISGDITEAKLVQGFVAASSAGGCCPSAGAGCCPK